MSYVLFYEGENRAIELGLETPLRFVVGDEQKVNETALTSGEEILEALPVSEMVIVEPQPGNSVPGPQLEGILHETSTTSNSIDVYAECDESYAVCDQTESSVGVDYFGSNLSFYQTEHCDGE